MNYSFIEPIIQNFQPLNKILSTYDVPDFIQNERKYEACPESIQSFLITREPVARP